MRMKLVWSLLVSMVFLCSATNIMAKSDAVDDGYYTAKDKEFYLSPEQLLSIRPGLVVEILEVVIPADMQLEVTYSIKDSSGQPLDAEGVLTPGEVDMRFTLANIPMDEEQKVRLAYERTSRNGTLTSVSPGVYNYKFETVLTSDMNTTHTLVLGFRRDLRDFDMDRYPANDLQDWVPSGMYDAVPRDVVREETCNRCHDPLTEHGRWLSVAACDQCHNPSYINRSGDVEPEISMDFLIHAVHAGTEAGGHDFSEMEYPAEIIDCQVCHTGGTPTEAFPMVANPAVAEVCDTSGLGMTTITWGPDLDPFDIRMGTADGQLFGSNSGEGSTQTGKWIQDGTVFVMVDKATGETIQELEVNSTVFGCVSNAPGTPRGAAAVQHTNWMDHVSRAVCGSCHSDIDFATGEGHADGRWQFEDDSMCAACHTPATGEEFDISVKGAHTVLYKSVQFPGVMAKLISVANSGPGEFPTVTFSLGSKNAQLDPATLNRLRFSVSGPNDDFSYYVAETVGANAVQDGENWTYTFETPIPADAMGSYTVGVEGRNMIDIDFGHDEVATEEDQAQNSILAFAVTDSAAVERRQIVSDEKCENCHSNLSLHGDNRNNADYCTTCHQADLTDDAVRPEEELPANSVHMKYMVHKIHRGADLDNGYLVYGYRGSLHDYSHVEYSGDLRNCDACHINNSQQIGEVDNQLPTTTPRDWWTPTLPDSAACLSCHDGDDEAVHAYSNTVEFGESCSVCHGDGKSASVDKVHAR